MSETKNPADVGESDTIPVEKTEGEEKEPLQDTDYDEVIKAEETKESAKERFEEKKVETGEEEDKPLTRREMQKLLEDREDKIRKETREEKALEYAGILSKNPKEAQAIIAVWKNRKLAGTLQEQLEEAQAIANHKRLKSQNSELRRALNSKDSVKTDGINPQRKPTVTEPNLSAIDKTAVAGMVWDNAKGAYKKTIAGGRKLFFVSRDLKKRWTEDTPQK